MAVKVSRTWERVCASLHQVIKGQLTSVGDGDVVVLLGRVRAGALVF